MSDSSSSDATDGRKPCPSCGAEIRALATLCRHCGQRVPTSETKRCTECAEDIPVGAERCNYCGSDQPGISVPEAGHARPSGRRKWPVVVGAASVAVVGLAVAAFLFTRSNVPPAVKEARDRLDCSEYRDEFEVEKDSKEQSLLFLCVSSRAAESFKSRLEGGRGRYIASSDMQAAINCAVQHGQANQEEELAECLIGAGVAG